jgi:hypothetical protein
VIPHLKTLCFGGNRFGVLPEFVVMYVKFHADSENHDEGWELAEEHWERVVNLVLNTDAVKADAQGDAAIEQAVGAAAELLHLLAKQGGCPQCPRLPPRGPEEPVKQGRV